MSWRYGSKGTGGVAGWGTDFLGLIVGVLGVTPLLAMLSLFICLAKKTRVDELRFILLAISIVLAFSALYVGHWWLTILA